jgi:hypothetical protein
MGMPKIITRREPEEREMKQLLIAITALSITGTAVHAVDFIVTRECTIAHEGKAPIHTTCVIKGGEQDGGLDVSVRIPDGHTYSLDGPIDGEGGNKFLLQNHPAKKTSLDDAEETCYARNDGKLEICAK